MVEIEIVSARLEEDQLVIVLADGREWRRQFPPDAGTLERLQQRVDEIGPDVVALSLVAANGNVAALAGAKLIGDFEQPLAMVQVRLAQ